MENDIDRQWKLDPEGAYLEVAPLIALEEFENLIRDSIFEIGGAFQNGQLVFAPKIGTSRSISFVFAEILLMRDGLLVHNHPRGSCFSSQDLQLAAVADLSILKVVGSFGDFLAHRPASGWPRANVLYQQAERLYREAQAESFRLYREDRSNGLNLDQGQFFRRWSNLTYNYLKVGLAPLGVVIEAL